jgi:spermidine synthase
VTKGPADRERSLSLLLLLFACSGCAALIYEIIWFQMLELVIGASGVSLGVLLGTFMGGMFLGSLALPRLVTATRHPLRVYAALEAGIGALGLALLWVIPLAGGVYTGIVGHGFANVLLRALVCALLLLPPTVLMGATLPAVARWIETTPRGVSWMGFFYGGNIAGAVAGSLIAAFYLLRVHDVATATYVAATLNGVVSLAAVGLAKVLPHRAPTDQPAEDAETPQPVLSTASRVVYIAIAISGLTALGAEVVWTRVLSLLLGPTVYTFAIILAVFLSGLGIGSGAGSYLARTLERPRLALGVCQFALAGAIAWTAVLLAAMPNWPIMPNVAASPRYVFQVDLLRTVCAILLPALLWGASFPLAVAALASKGQDPARLLGGVYAANTLGAIAGALAFGMLVIPGIGTRNAQRLLIVLVTLSAAILLVPVLWSERRQVATSAVGLAAPARIQVPWLPAGLALAFLLVIVVPATSPSLVAYGRFAAASNRVPSTVYVGEGMNASVAVTQGTDGHRHFHVSGKTEASTTPEDMRLQRMLGHLPALLHERPRSVLVIGFGAGVTAGSFVTHPSIERIVICEIEPLIPNVVSRYFSTVNHDVLRDPRVEVVYDDARHYIRTTRETFDIIASDPIQPWVRGSAALYTLDYFEMAKRHLNPGGIMTLWVPLYGTSAAAVKSEMATFFRVFHSGTVWGNDLGSAGYDLVLAGGTAPMRLDLEAIQQRFDATDHARVRESMRDVGFSSPIDLLEKYAGQAPDLVEWLRGAEINRDRNLRLMYTAGMSLNTFEHTQIYADMLGYRAFPELLFTGPLESRNVLRVRMSAPVDSR